MKIRTQTVDPQKCPRCGAVQNRLTDSIPERGTKREARKGDLAMCVVCAEVFLLDEKLNMQVIPPDYQMHPADILEVIRARAFLKQIHEERRAE